MWRISKYLFPLKAIPVVKDQESVLDHPSLKSNSEFACSFPSFNGGLPRFLFPSSRIPTYSSSSHLRLPFLLAAALSFSSPFFLSGSCFEVWADNLHPNWDRSLVIVGVSLMISVVGAAICWIGNLVDLYGPSVSPEEYHAMKVAGKVMAVLPWLLDLILVVGIILLRRMQIYDASWIFYTRIQRSIAQRRAS